MEKSIVWKGLDDDTEEHCSINYHDDCIKVHSEIEGWANNKAVYVEYWLKLAPNWDVMEFEVTTHIADTEFIYALTRDEDGNWKDKQGKIHPQFKNCRYIDITLTPFTNTLPVNGLHLKEGEGHDIEVVYINVLKHEMAPFKQRYTKLKSQQYKYENRDGSFSADITVDEDGFVTHYPGLFEMIRVIKHKPNG